MARVILQLLGREGHRAEACRLQTHTAQLIAALKAAFLERPATAIASDNSNEFECGRITQLEQLVGRQAVDAAGRKKTLRASRSASAGYTLK